MKKIFIILISLPFFLNSFGQTACSKLRAKGYKQGFCDYNKKYAYKNIPFEISFDSISSKLKLTKRTGSPFQYDCKDADVLRWATITFNNCIFDFSSTDKLDGIQLQLFNNSSTSIPEIKSKINQLRNYLILYFGKPEKFPGTKDDMWKGDKVYIVVSPPNEKLESGAVIAIYRTNTNAIDDL